MDIEAAKKECLRILSKDGHIKFEDITEPIAKATWLAFEKGFMASFELLHKPIVESIAVCADCSSVGISDANCICTYSNGYPTEVLPFHRCAVCEVLNDYPVYDNQEEQENNNNTPLEK